MDSIKWWKLSMQSCPGAIMPGGVKKWSQSWYFVPGMVLRAGLATGIMAPALQELFWRPRQNGLHQIMKTIYAKLPRSYHAWGCEKMESILTFCPRDCAKRRACYWDYGTSLTGAFLEAKAEWTPSNDENYLCKAAQELSCLGVWKNGVNPDILSEGLC